MHQGMWMYSDSGGNAVSVIRPCLPAGIGLEANTGAGFGDVVIPARA